MSAFLSPIHVATGGGHARGVFVDGLHRRHALRVHVATRARGLRVVTRDVNMTLTNTDTREIGGIQGSKLALKEILEGVWQLAKPLWKHANRKKSFLWLMTTVLFAFIATMYAVLFSNVKKLFWNVISKKDVARFPKLMLGYAIVVTLGPIILGLFDWVKERFANMWRAVLTDELMNKYFYGMNYYKLSQGFTDIDNPDQRIAEDVYKFTSRAVRFFTVIGVSVFDFIIFSVILYNIYSPLWYVLIAYASLGTIATALVGQRLLQLNKAQAKREADFRFGLVRVREATENIAFYRGEQAERTQLLHRFRQAFNNYISLTGVRRDVSFLTRSFQYWAQVVPTLVIAPQYFAGKVMMGVISQVYFSFNHVLSSVGLLVAEFSALAEFAAGVRRLKGLADAMDSNSIHHLDDIRIETRESENGVEGFKVMDLTVKTPTKSGKILVKDLSFNVENGKRLLVIGRSGLGKSSLMRAICGLWDNGSGYVWRPNSKHTLFLPQRPFLMLGTLRDNVIYPSDRKDVSDTEVENALRQANLGYLLDRDEGLDSSGETLTRRLSLGEQQRLAFARILIFKPKAIILDESTSALDIDNEKDMYDLISRLDMTVISVGNRPSLLKMHDHVLKLEAGGRWTLENTDMEKVQVGGDWDQGLEDNAM